MGRTNPLHKPDDPDTLGLLSKAIQDGLTPVSAAEAIGIPRSTHYEWMAAHPPYSDTAKAAVAKLKRELAKSVRTAAKSSKNWAAAMTMLERLFPDEYGRRDRVQHAHAGQIGVVVAPVRLTSEAALKLLDVEASLSEGEMLSLPPGPAREFSEDSSG